MTEVLDLQEAAPYRKILIYGLPGVGKTVFCARAPKPIIVDTEHGVLSLKNHQDILDSSIKVLAPRSWDEVDNLMWKLQQAKDSDPNLADRETLIIDSFSEAQRRVLDEQLRSQHTYIPQGKDYQENTERLRRFAMFIRDLPMHIVVTCHVREHEDEVGIVTYKPDVTNKVGQTLLGLFDLVGFFRLEVDEHGNETRLLQTRKTEKVTAKTRLNLPPVIVNPNIVDLLQGGHDIDNDPEMQALVHAMPHLAPVENTDEAEETDNQPAEEVQ